MKAYAIVLKNDMTSERGYSFLTSSSHNVKNEFEIERFDATHSKNVIDQFKKLFVDWTWPWIGQQLCFKTGLTMSAYQTQDPNKRVACFMSHHRLWTKCVELDEPILVLEHDAVFTEKLPKDIDLGNYNIVGINDPRGATRKSREFYNNVVHGKDGIVSIPKIDAWNVPQGLAGNSAYIITPQGAKDLIAKVKEIGAWPNDALMCYQNISNMGVTKTFYTKVQGLPSTTTQ
jgi:GR25 family glycosyltransferase involved in LPS biosynthesis